MSRIAALLVLFVAHAGAPALAQDAAAGERVYDLVDRPLIEARGTRYRFRSDLVDGSALLVSFTFTGCQKLCRPSDAVMDALAKRLEGDVNVKLVTITLDPLGDTPERLLEARVRQNAPSRLFLTGEARDVFAVLDGLGVSAGVEQDHPIEFIAIARGGGAAVGVSELDPDQILAALETVR